jgi:predicted N-formylglutamate amidohydrolase
VECSWLLTCEHASNAVPSRFRSIFSESRDLLNSHRGYDIGAKHYAQELSKRLSCPLLCGDVTRLLVDLNRSLHNPHLFSPISRSLDQTTKQKILSLYYTPFRANVRQFVEEKVSSGGRVIHLSCHSFTPVLYPTAVSGLKNLGPLARTKNDSPMCLGREGVERTMDVGILYDPHRREEKTLSQALLRELRLQTSMCVRLNAPYKGISDGHVTSLRRLFSSEQYVGLELEVNQSLYLPKISAVWQHAWLPRVVDALRCVVSAL